MHTPKGYPPVVVDWDGNVSKIDLLPGDIAGQARSINNAGVVVGLSDDPPGPDGGPQAYVWSKDQTIIPKFGEKSLYSAAHAINNAGQVAGLIDVISINGKLVPIDPLKVDYDDVESAKTLAFRWTPAQ